MVKIVIVTLATVIPLAPFVMYILSLRSKNPLKAAENLVFAFKGYNVFLILMALGVGVVCVAVSGTGAAAIGAIAEKPEALGRSLIFVGLAEGVAIYGLLIAFLVLFG
jgi:V/A-type H+-transporting ATPase subunit K